METKAVANDDELAKLKSRVQELEAELSGGGSWPSNTVNPIVIDLGKTTKKRIKALRNGRGKLVGEIAEAVAEVRSHLSEDEKNALAIPVVLLYKKKSKSAKRLFGL